MVENRSRLLACRIVTVPICLFLWEGISRSGLFNQALFPPPSHVFVTLWRDLLSGLLITDTAASLSRVLVGYAAGALLGVSFGLLTGRLKWAHATLGQLFLLVRPIPPISFVPLAVLWFGLGEFSKYFLVFIGVFFPVWMNSHLGIQNVKRSYVWTARTMGASRRSMILDVYLPGSAPFVVAGLRVAIAISFYCLVAAEIAGAFSGLAYRIEISHLVFRADRMLAGLVVLGLLSAAADQGLAFLIRRLLPWHQKV